MSKNHPTPEEIYAYYAVHQPDLLVDLDHEELVDLDHEEAEAAEIQTAQGR